jgi:hypothetical protein
VLLADTNAEARSDGTLCFTLPEWKRTTFVIEPWGRGLAATSIRGRAQRPAHLWSMVVVSAGRRRGRPNPDVEAFVGQIPEVARDLVRHHVFGQLLVLQLLALHHEIADLADSNVNLLWLLVLAAYEGRLPPSSFVSLCRRKQVDVVAELTGRGAKAHVKFLRKVQLADGSLSEARTIQSALFEPRILESVRHLPAIPVRLLSLLTRYPRLASDAFIPLIAAKLAEPEGDDPDKLFSLHQRLTGLGRVATTLRVEQVREALAGPVVAEVLREARPAARASTRDIPELALEETFPSPPLPGSSDIVPITTFSALREEAETQRNCVLGYAGSVRNREAYLYRVLRPERATVEVTCQDGVWALGQVKLARNVEPGRKTVLLVKRWFKNATREAETDRRPAAEE